MFKFVLSTMILTLVLVTSVFAEYDEYDENYDYEASLKIGVSAPHFDDVGHILRHFGAGVDFYTLSHEDASNLERLKEFYAIFINCGSHAHFNYEVLNSYVYQGGIVYASDLAGNVLQQAFPGIVEFESSPSQMVSDANIAHSTLSAHMRLSYIDVIFDLDNWFAITSLDSGATIYIEGELRTHGLTPLAMSFNYGEGTVFYTSFHNSAQATANMINFIEYLIFRIKNVEVDRNLQDIAEREGFRYRGAVFAAPRAGLATAPAAGSAAEADSDFFAGGAAAAPAPLAPAGPESFSYTFEGQDFMLMFGPGSAFYYVTLTDPHGNIFTVDNYGTVTGEITAPSVMQPTITLEVSDGYRIRVTNVTPGEWRFFAVPRDNYSAFMIGIAVME